MLHECFNLLQCVLGPILVLLDSCYSNAILSIYVMYIVMQYFFLNEWNERLQELFREF